MAIFLHALALENYGGIGPEMQRMPSFKDFNFFVGANNAGKSTILNFLFKRLSNSYFNEGSPSSTKRTPLSNLEIFNRGLNGTTRMAVGVPTPILMEKICGLLRPGDIKAENYARELCKALSPEGVAWLICGFQSHEMKFEEAVELSLKLHNFRDIPPRGEEGLLISQEGWYALASNIGNYRGGNLSQWISEVLEQVKRTLVPMDFPETQLIPAHRRIGPKGENFEDYSGSGLIQKLAEIQNPDHSKLDDAIKFEKINKFLQNVTDQSSAKIEVPHHREHLAVHMNNLVLPLEALGTGIHEVIMIASFCTLSDKK